MAASRRLVVAFVAVVVGLGCEGEDTYNGCGNRQHGNVYSRSDDGNTYEWLKTCDDGNKSTGDGCDDWCQIETGWNCPNFGEPCVPTCGDGTLVDGEVCDPGVPMDEHYCDQCQTLIPGRCGDGVVLADLEICDDGNDVDYDGCTDCQVDFSFTCNAEGTVCEASGLEPSLILGELTADQCRAVCEWMLTFYGPIGTLTQCGSSTIESYGVESCVRNALGGDFGNSSNCSVGWAESVAAEAGSLCAFYYWDELC